MEKVSLSKINEYRELFDLFDSDKDGCLDISEVCYLLSFLIYEQNPIFSKKSESQVQQVNPHTLSKIFNSSLENRLPILVKELIFELDHLDAGELISFEEFLSFMVRKLHIENNSNPADKVKATLINALKEESDEGDVISVTRMKSILAEINEELTEEEIDEIIAEVTQGDHINILEFIEYVLN